MDKILFHNHLEVVNIKKYLLIALLIFGLTLTIGMYGVSAATSDANTSINSSLSDSQSTTTAGTVSTTSTNKLSSNSVSKSVSSSPKTIKVLIYNGHGAITSCVVGSRNRIKVC